MNKSILLASVAALALCAGGASAAGQHPVTHAPMTHGAAKFKTANRAATVLYDQNDDAQGFSDTSQNFESTFDAYDNQGSDDFVVPSGTSWKVSEVDVTGLYYKGSGSASAPADSENVFFYKAKKGEPKKLVAEVDNVVGDDDGVGDFVITLAKKDQVKLKSGTYFVSVQANMDFSTAGQWGWGTRNTQVGSPAQWQNPGEGFGTGCDSWSDESTCLGGTAGPDHMFTLRGKAK